MVQGGCDQSLGHVRLRMWALEKVSSACGLTLKLLGTTCYERRSWTSLGISPVPSSLWWSPTISHIPSLDQNWYFDFCEVPGYWFVVILFLPNSFIGIYFVYHMIHTARMSGTGSSTVEGYLQLLDRRSEGLHLGRILGTFHSSPFKSPSEFEIIYYRAAYYGKFR